MADQTAREEQHHQHEHHAVDEAVGAISERTEPTPRQFSHWQHEQGACERAGDRAQSANQREHRNLDREFKRERGRRLDERQVHGVKRPEHAGQRRGYDRSGDLDAHRVDTHRACGIFPFAYRDQVEAKSRVADQPTHPQSDREESKRYQEVGPLLAKNHPLQSNVERNVESGRAAGSRLEVHHQQAADLQHGDGCQRKKRAAQSQRWIGDHQRGDDRDQCASEHAKPGRHTKIDDQHRRRVAADRIEHRVSKRQLPRVATDDVPCRGQRGEHAHLNRQVIDERRIDCQGHGKDRDECQRTGIAARMGQLREHHDLAYSEPRPRPNSPVGRTIRMTRKITKYTTSFRSGPT